MRSYIWQQEDWTKRLTYNSDRLIIPLGLCRFLQGKLLSDLQNLGFEDRQKAYAGVLVEEAIKTSEIEGERLDPAAVRSSVAQRLGLPDGGLRPTRNRHADGVVSVLLDATSNLSNPLTAQRMKGWQAL